MSNLAETLLGYYRCRICGKCHNSWYDAAMDMGQHALDGEKMDKEELAYLKKMVRYSGVFSYLTPGQWAGREDIGC